MDQHVNWNAVFQRMDIYVNQNAYVWKISATTSRDAIQVIFCCYHSVINAYTIQDWCKKNVSWLILELCKGRIFLINSLYKVFVLICRYNKATLKVIKTIAFFKSFVANKGFRKKISISKGWFFLVLPVVYIVPF